MDFAKQIEHMRELRETTPHAAAVPGAPAKKMAHRAANVKKSKEMEFPVAPYTAEKKSKK